ncbi:MAG: hypothetical protein KDB79_02675 [Acidobacteria bacterium]|nr:hypothetical protein [Acidobacteriota bacterium]
MKLFSIKKTITISAFGMVALFGINGTADAQRKQDRSQPRQTERRQERSTPQAPTVPVQKGTDNRGWNSNESQRGNAARQNAVAQQRAAAERQAIANQRAALERQRIAQRQQQIRLEQERQEQLRRQAQLNNRYRVYRNGGYYQTDQRGAELLKEAVNRGYQQGFQAGQSDRANRRKGNHYNSSVYRSGNYGYQSYVDSSQYQYYFRQGFEKGYQDGYNSRYQYGQRTNNGLNILGAILSGILNLQSY